ncbi:MAG: 2,3-cyclic 3-phosphodiesterase [Solirubrobacteraceae bacterium]|jgi:2'-5' RNA ligase|nr:2,3-cyclic 3-phosphodiesterase [Solirubrobacteraceae bacterium]
MRLFVALDLPADARAGLAAWADTAAPAAVRRVPEANLHVTLAFLGPRSEPDAGTVGALLAGLARPLGPLHSAGALWLPPRRPGVLAVALHGAQDLSSLRADLVAGLESAIGFEAERRPFAPHVTVGRVRRGTPVDTRHALDPAAPELAFAPAALTLYRSHTGAGGARYEPLARVGVA